MPLDSGCRYFGPLHALAVVEVLHWPALVLRWDDRVIASAAAVILALSAAGFDCPGDYRSLFGDRFDAVDRAYWFPNLGFALAGVACSRAITKVPNDSPLGNALRATTLPVIGQHALLVYVTHQFVAFPLVALIRVCIAYLV